MTKPLNKEGFGLVSESFHIKEMNKKDAEIKWLRGMVKEAASEWFDRQQAKKRKRSYG